MSMKPSVGGRKLLNGAIGTLCLNWVYYNGEGTTKNVNEAVRWWLMAGEGEEESDEAEYLLGLCYWNGEGGLQKSYKEAVKWWQKAARHDHPEAKNALKKLDETW